MEKLTYYDNENSQYDLICCRDCEHHTAQDCLYCKKLNHAIQQLGKLEEQK